jgi:hypothetical protein
MHKARAFFFVCAGIFLLALSYHLGARSAGAQAPGNPVVEVKRSSNGNLISITSNGDAYESVSPSADGPWSFRSNVFSGAIPAPGNPVVGIERGSDVGMISITSNGDVYQSSDDSGAGPWAFRSNVFGSATPAQAISIGQLKAKYAK